VSDRPCYCGACATVSVPGVRDCVRRICAQCHRREEDGSRLHAERLDRANRQTRERIAARPRCSDHQTEPQQYYFRQRLGNRVPAGDGLCWDCVDKAAPQSDAERVDRRIAVQRLVRAAMRSREHSSTVPIAWDIGRRRPRAGAVVTWSMRRFRSGTQSDGTRCSVI
jgi:hypothetical protein